MTTAKITEEKAREILSEISVDEWCRPIMDSLAAIWALERISELENQIAKLKREAIECRQANNEKRDIIDTWNAVASMCDVPQWDGIQYSDDRTWAKRVFATIEKMMEEQSA